MLDIAIPTSPATYLPGLAAAALLQLAIFTVRAHRDARLLRRLDQEVDVQVDLEDDDEELPERLDTLLVAFDHDEETGEVNLGVVMDEGQDERDGWYLIAPGIWATAEAMQHLLVVPEEVSVTVTRRLNQHHRRQNGELEFTRLCARYLPGETLELEPDDEDD
jgi:hypothetical protein